MRNGIHAGRGIFIDAGLRTSAKDIYAIGDCAEYSGTICRTAKTAVKHANILANLLREQDDHYDLSFCSALFKFADLNVALIGRTGEKAGGLMKKRKFSTKMKSPWGRLCSKT